MSRPRLVDRDGSRQAGVAENVGREEVQGVRVGVELEELL
jgi:hypothetical protein